MTSPAPRLRLLPPPPVAPPPALDAAQQGALDAALGGLGSRPGHAVVIGAPGAGKTRLVVAAAVAAVERGTAPERVLVLAPTRDAAARLRDLVSAALDRPVGAPTARTPASAAHAILGAHADAHGEPRPVMVTGAEQDQILRELLEAHLRGEGRVPDWAGVVPPAATALPGFRAELRDVLMRASEAGLVAADLARLSGEVGRPEWAAAATVMAEYEDVLWGLSSTPDQGARFDPAAVVAQAAHVLRTWDPDVDGAPPRWDLVIVDDAQELTAAGLGLLDAVAEHGARLVLVGNADQAVQGYRGALPGCLAAALRPAPAGWSASLYRLGEGRRQPAALARVTAAAIERIGVAGAGSARHPLPPAGPDGEVEILTAGHRHAHSRAIAGALRAARHGLDGGRPVPWGGMVVVARSAARLRELRADLAGADIPCQTLGEGTALHREPAVAPMLTMARRAAALARGEPGPWDPEAAVALLESRPVGLDPVGLRRLRRALVRADREAGGTATSEELLVAALDHPARWAAVSTAEARLAERAARAIHAGAGVAGGPPGAVLWAMWDALGVAERWRDAALAGSARDDGDLDAVIALLRAAQAYAERLPGASVVSFVEHLEGQDFAADSLGARGRVRDAVAFCTPAGAAGREWDVVVVAGLEEGVWPDLRLRDSVLGAQHLADVLAGRAPREPVAPDRRPAAARAARRAVLDDETRAFAVALSRARRRLVLTCVEGEDARPSRFLAWAAVAAGVDPVRADAVPRVSDLRGAVAAIRARAESADGADLAAHVEALAILARSGVAGADPAAWHGVPEPSTEHGMWDPEAPVRVSPSRLETLETCPLRWALESVGGTVASTESQSLGTLVHEIAAELPAGTHAQLAAALERRWPDIAGTETWPDRVLRDKADAMIRRLAGYVASVQTDVVRVEQPFAVPIDRAVVAGSADRVEIIGDRARIVDLKTGQAVTQAEAADHAQLAMYQLAAEHGAFDGVSGAEGAALVYVGGGTQGASERSQPPIDVVRERARLGDAVRTMAAGTFTAITNDRCGACPARRSCPAWPSGRQVTDG